MLIHKAFLPQTFVRYAGVSLMALGADTGCFLGLLAAGTPPVPASVVGYLLGIVLHWLLSSQLVFRGRLAGSAAGRLRQKALFMASALVGLALTALVVGAGAALAIAPVLAKAGAIGVSFLATWALRHWWVFGGLDHATGDQHAGQSHH